LFLDERLDSPAVRARLEDLRRRKVGLVRHPADPAVDPALLSPSVAGLRPTGSLGDCCGR
jgi:hypothetical protein